MSRYYNFSKEKFEYELRGILIRNRLGKLYDVTDKYIESGHSTLEKIYLIPTRNKSVSILIYSSIDIFTGRVREKGSDAIRVVMAWKTKNGPIYKRLAKHLRIQGVFSNLEKTLVKSNQDIYNLKIWEFTKNISDGV